MSIKHTPGPWLVADGGDGISSGGSGEWFNPIGGCGCCSSPWINPSESEEEARANARLIAAAPELLAELRDMVAVATDDNWDRASTGRQIVLEAARAAIAKAEGAQ